MSTTAKPHGQIELSDPPSSQAVRHAPPVQPDSRCATLQPPGEGPGRHTRKLRTYLIGLIAAALMAAYVGSGFYEVAADERGVVRRFGAVAQHVDPGIHYRLPWPIDRVDVIKTTSVMKTGVGFRLPNGVPDSEVVTGMELLTGDTNILSIALVLQYVIRDPADFLFRIEDPHALVDAVAQTALTEAVAAMPIDEVLTTGRVAMQEMVKTRVQTTLDRYRSGVQISSANIMTMALDRSVAAAFQDVADAMADREKLQNEARAYQNDLIPKARGEARTTISQAEAYKQQRIAEAVGEADRFLALLREYQKAPDITRSRLYLEAIEKVLPKVKLYVLDSDHGRVPLNLRVTAP
jgi:membrane protease subunit HflK